MGAERIEVRTKEVLDDILNAYLLLLLHLRATINPDGRRAKEQAVSAPGMSWKGSLIVCVVFLFGLYMFAVIYPKEQSAHNGTAPLCSCPCPDGGARP